mmetsp:Transcript_22947/g.39267  ORF Transcript_22947/g.39267 Transcript_22947/m.39267 type:complete len:672 (+) Transcript_22947:67-2082(+)
MKLTLARLMLPQTTLFVLISGARASHSLPLDDRHTPTNNLRRLASPTCIDGTCRKKCGDCCPGNDCSTYETDCGASCSGGPVCGDGTCDTAGGEDCTNCATDCIGIACPEQCGTCSSDASISCLTAQDCPSTNVCDAACYLGDGSSCAGTLCNNKSDCPPNNGPNQGKCEAEFNGVCNLDTCAPTLSPTPAPTNSPTTSPTGNPTPMPVPTTPPTWPPTGSPIILTPIPTDSPIGATASQAIGQFCSLNSQCLSGTCVNGACYASNNCKALKHDVGSTFDTEQVLLLFVGSGFTDLATWETEVARTFSVFSNYKMFASTTTQYTALYSTHLEPSFCDYWCNNIERLLCCTISTARTISADCIPFGSSYHPNVQMVVVHNDVKYGGAGYISSNVGTTSIHSSGPKVAIHELGHSLFELADEYPTGSGTSSRANCDTAGCSKWTDLQGNTAVEAEYGVVGCQAACSGDNYFVGQTSYMEYLSSPVGAVNDRYTCCAYQAISKSMPDYCSVFEFGSGLFNFCKDNDYQNFGPSNYDPAPPSGSSDDDGSSNYVQLGDATIVTVDLGGGSWNTRSGGNGVFIRGKVMGDYASPQDAAAAGKSELYRTTITYSDNSKRVYFMAATEHVEVPLVENGGHGGENASVRRASLDLALDTPAGEIIDVLAEQMPVGLFQL